MNDPPSTRPSVPAKPIALIGMPGSGKTSAGRQLARQLGRPFVDTDHAIVERVGIPVAEFFARYGEAAFRDTEEEVLAALIGQGDSVIATGGGIVLRAANRERLRSETIAVFLRAPREMLWMRLRNDTRRPLLQVQDPRARLMALHAERDPLYRRTAHYAVDTGRSTALALVHRILMQLEMAGVVDAFRATPSPLSTSPASDGALPSASNRPPTLDR